MCWQGIYTFNVGALPSRPIGIVNHGEFFKYIPCIIHINMWDSTYHEQLYGDQFLSYHSEKHKIRLPLPLPWKNWRKVV
jgi:hypothetical protein